MKKYLPIIVIVILVVLQFYPSFKSNYLFTTSGDWTYSPSIGDSFPDAFYRGWNNIHYLGNSTGTTPINLYYLFFSVFSSQLAYRLMWIIPLIFFFIFAWIYAKRNKEYFYSRLFFATSVSFSPIYASFIFVGHPGKMHSIPFFILTLFFIDEYFSNKRIRCLAYGGVALGMSFVGGASQTVMYWSFVVAAYFLWQLLTKGRSLSFVSKSEIKTWFVELTKFLILPTIAFFFAFPILGPQWLSNQSTSITESLRVIEIQEENADSKRSTSQGWGWATQWSFPPEEVLDFFAPGFFGYKSNDPEHPYWSRCGQSPGFSIDNPQGYKNFSYASNYMGLLTIFLALFSWLFIRNKEIQFWWFIVFVSLFLAFGRFSFLGFPYTLFYELPLMDSFRNPNKFLHIMFIPMHLLAYFTFCEIEKAVREMHIPSSFRRIPQVLYWVFGVVTLVFLVALFSSDLLNYLRKLYDVNTSNIIRGNFVSSYVRFFLLFALIATPIILLIRKQFSPKITHGLFSFLIIVSLLDVLHINHIYFDYREYPDKQEPDQITQFFIDEMKKNPGRIKILHRGAYANYFMSLICSEYQLSSIDPPAESRPPAIFYQGYYKYMDMNNLKSYQILNIRFFMSSIPLNIPALEQRLYLQHPGTRENIFIYELKDYLPKVQVVHQYFEETNALASFDTMQSSLFNPKTSVVHMETGDYASFYPEVTEVVNLNSFARLTTYKANLIECEVNMEANGCLVLADLFHPDWKAYVDGEAQPINRVNFFLRGLLLEKGTHKVVFKYEPSLFSFYISLTSWVIVIILLLYYFFNCLRAFTKENKKKLSKNTPTQTFTQ